MLPRLIFILLVSVNCLHVGIGGSIRVKEIRCECGIRNEGERHLGFGDNVNTEFAGNHAWPWMASIVNISVSGDPVAYCGASIINSKYIVTASHCIPDMQTGGLGNFRVWLGTNFITNDIDEDFIELEISEIKSHPKFDFETAEYDVALIKVSETIPFSKKIRPVCLKQFEDAALLGQGGVITGWGSLNLTQPTEEELKEADVRIVSNEDCRKNYSTVDIPILDTMLCGSLDGQDPCKGDSGGPLVLKDAKNRFNLIGIISHGQGCAAEGYPTIFSRVSKFIEWIQHETEDALYCRGTF